MATAIAFGSVTITDLTDLGEFSVQPMSNLPLSVIYDPDQNTFTPNWGTSTLQVTPAIYYAGKPLTLGSTTGLTVTWQRQEGVGAKTELTTCETVVNGGVLNVAANKFTSNSTMITYIVTSTYEEPTSGETLTAAGQITFSLIRNAGTAKTVSITGDSIFKYNSEQTLVGASTIVLTATLTNCAIVEWRYQDSNGDFVKYPGSTTAATLNVNATDNVFVNDKCLIKVVTNDNNVFDYYAITKLRDGAAGTTTVSAVLTNDDQMVPFKNGVGDYTSAVSRIMIYDGGSDVTSTWTINTSWDTNVINATRSQTVANNDTIAITALNAATGNVTFTCTKTGYNTITKTFSLVKVESGADGVSPTIYSVEADAYAINKSITNVFTPASVTFTGYQQTGSTKSSYSGRFMIFENVTTTEYDEASTKPTPSYTSTTDEASHTYTPSTSATSILCFLFEAGATTKRYDTQYVAIASDGQTGPQGQTGDAGQSAINVVLGNYADVLACTHANTLQGNQTVRIPFDAYEGTTKIPCVVTSIALLGKTPTIQNANATQSGYIEWALTSGTAVSASSGTLSITFTSTTSGGDSVVTTENYTWTRSTAAKDGENAVNLQVFTPNGANIFNQDISSVEMRAQLTDGGTDVTSSTGVTWQWAKWTIQSGQGSYVDISGATTSSYIATSANVDTYASFRVTATYNNKPYVGYYSVFDRTDPIQVTVLSSLGTQIVNGQGAGAIYALVTRNNSEIDKIKSERFLTSNPTSAKSGDYYYRIDTTNKTIKLMKYTTSWTESSETYEGTYTWVWRDKDGNNVTTMNGYTLPASGKVIYIDGDMIDGKIIADVEVTI